MFEAPQLCLLYACWGREKTEWLVFFLLNSGSDLWHPLNRGENHLLSHLWHLVYTLLKSRCRTQSIFDFSQKHHSHKALMHIVEFTGKKNGHAGYVCSCYTSILKTKTKKNRYKFCCFLKHPVENSVSLVLRFLPNFYLSSLLCSVILLQIHVYFISGTIYHSSVSYFSLSSTHLKLLFLAYLVFN